MDTYASDDQSPHLQFKESEVSYPRNSKDLSTWYINRAKEIEAKSGQVSFTSIHFYKQVENALTLIELGSSKSVENLQVIQDDLRVVFSVDVVDY